MEKKYESVMESVTEPVKRLRLLEYIILGTLDHFSSLWTL